MLIRTVWPQASPKSGIILFAVPNATSGGNGHNVWPCAAKYYRNSAGVCVHRPVRTENSRLHKERRPSAETELIRWANTDREHVYIMEELRSGAII